MKLYTVLENLGNDILSLLKARERKVLQLSAVARSRKKILSMFFDFISAFFCLWLAYTLRYGEYYTDLVHSWIAFPLVATSSVVCFSSMGVYRSLDC